MTTVILGDHPEVQTMIEQRRALGQDGSDEVWEGVYYVVPHAHVHHGLLQARLIRIFDDLVSSRGFEVSAEFNLGKQNDYRVPDLGLHRGTPDDLYVPTAAMIVEILSPNDKTFEKFDFYGRHGVEEILVADLAERWIRIWGYHNPSSSYREIDDSLILATSRADLQGAIPWP
jgi:Uma2 family endonuclease